MWRVGCLPPYHHHPVPYSLPFTRLPMGVGVWERRGAETARAGGMWWGTPEPIGASSLPLFKCWAHLSSGDRSLPRACMLVSSWVQEGSVEGLPETWAPDPRSGRNYTCVTAIGPGCWAGPTSPVERHGPRGRRSRWRIHRPSRPGPKREARAAAGLHPYLDSSFHNTG